MVAEEFEGVAAFDQADALVDQAFELDRLDLGAVLLGLAAALRLLVAVELALDAVDLAVEQVDERPEEIGADRPRGGCRSAWRSKASTVASSWPCTRIGFGQRPRIGLVLAGAIAVECQLVEQMRGRRGGVDVRGRCRCRGRGGGCRCVSWRVPFCRRIGRAHRGLHGDPLAGGGDGLSATPCGVAGAERAEDGAGQLFCFALQSRVAGLW